MKWLENGENYFYRRSENGIHISILQSYETMNTVCIPCYICYEAIFPLLYFKHIAVLTWKILSFNLDEQTIRL